MPKLKNIDGVMLGVKQIIPMAYNYFRKITTASRDIAADYLAQTLSTEQGEVSVTLDVGKMAEILLNTPNVDVVLRHDKKTADYIAQALKDHADEIIVKENK